MNGIDYKNTIFSPRWFMENCLYIIDKNKQLKLFKLNREQDIMLRHIEFCLENNEPIRIILLKARQIGATTFFSALGFWVTTMNKNMTYGIVAHRLDSSESIFAKCKVYYNNLESALRPSTTQFSSEGITFDKKNGKGIGSRIQFATVNEGVFRGQTLSYLHLSECAFWEGDVRAVENSLAPTISERPFTFLVRESTAKGYNSFKDFYDRAVRGENGYTHFFFGWQDHEEYVRAVPQGFTLTEEEKRIKERFKLSDEQMAWRRHEINNSYDGNETWFRQEYPMTPEEAFVASGGSVFDSQTIIDGYAGSKSPEKLKAIESYPVWEKLKIWSEPETRQQKTYQQKAIWDDEKQDYILVDTDLVTEECTYETPYTLSIDTSGMGADLNQIVVINNVTKELSARFGIKDIAEENLAKIAVEIAKYYNNALIAPEVNYSHEICNYITKLGYKNLYITENLTRQDMKVTGGVEYGWRTTTKSKPAIISNLRTIISANPSLIKDKDFWEEAEYYLMEDSTKMIMNAASGHHDDIIVAVAIGMYVSNSFQSKQSYKVVKNGKINDSFTKVLKHKKKKTPIRKGIYKNYA